MANKLELVSLGGIPHCYNRNVRYIYPNECLETPQPELPYNGQLCKSL